jgi:hypothetical protein
MMLARMLLKSCAIPPANWPIASILLACCNCFQVQTILLGLPLRRDVFNARDQARRVVDVERGSLRK